MKGVYANIPEVLTINVENLDLGKTIQVRELAFDNLEILRVWHLTKSPTAYHVPHTAKFASAEAVIV